MTIINLPDTVAKRAAEQASQSGYASVDAYLADLIQADEVRSISDEIERDLLAGLTSPAREITAADWTAKRDNLRQTAK